MKGKRYTEQQILDIIGQVEAGQPVVEVARSQGVAVTTSHRWKARYGGMTKDETKRPSSEGRGKSPPEKAGRRPVAGQPDAEGGDGKKVVNPEATPQAQTPLERRLVGHVRERLGISERRACHVLGFWHSTHRHDSPKREQAEALVVRLPDLAQQRPCFGYRRLQILLERRADGESQAGLPPVPRRGPAGAAPGSQEIKCWRAGAETGDFWPQSALEHGLHVRPVGLRTAIPRTERRG
ncbi:hypothetical protein E5F05_02530 (plasmid) [Deinococcus metallilatus]|nr:hypothetical protein E5F05_02530 [Deinococcus metallilatus]